VNGKVNYVKYAGRRKIEGSENRVSENRVSKNRVLRRISELRPRFLP
jgi:hypothetical protein